MAANAVGHHIVGASIADAWLAASEYLIDNGKDVFALLVEVSEPGSCSEGDSAVRAALDAVLRGREEQDTQTVANTIFPRAYLAGGDADHLFETYDRNWPLIRELSVNNRKGTYFRRLTNAQVIGKNGDVAAINPLDAVLKKIRTQLTRSAGGALRCAYPLAVYDASSDRSMTMGFPCLSLVDLKIDRGRLHLFAQYRNQHFFRKAFGNYLGLADLQRFVAAEVGLTVGSLFCLATHAEFDGPISVVRACKFARSS